MTNFTSHALNETSCKQTASMVRALKRGIRVNLVQGGYIDFTHAGAFVAGPYPTQQLLNQLNNIF